MFSANPLIYAGCSIKNCFWKKALLWDLVVRNQSHRLKVSGWPGNHPKTVMRSRPTRETQNGGDTCKWQNKQISPKIDTFYVSCLWEVNPDTMSQGKRFLRALSRIGYPKANEYEGDNFEWLFDCESLTPFLEWFCENIHEENVLSHDDLKR